jgi:Mlc titration factor MtfA (ptsG expression regulator)
VAYLTAFGIVLLVAFIIVRLIKFFDNRPVTQNTPGAITTQAATQADNAGEGPKDYYIYEGSNLGLTDDEITGILIKYYPYYNRLWPTVQYRFQQRLFTFIKSKSFIIYSQQPYKEMPVLTSAAAIHLTLGLDEYLLPWFKYICIHTEAYFASDSLRVLAGNVEGEMITVAWDQLLKGIKNETDGNNVGLHEMAHALYYQLAVVDNNQAVNFSENFENIMQEGVEVYKLKDARHILYSDYAYRNLQEFWAESVEIFFEKPAEMQKSYPQIYETIKDLLKQDAVKEGNPLC